MTAQHLKGYRTGVLLKLLWKHRGYTTRAARELSVHWTTLKAELERRGAYKLKGQRSIGYMTLSEVEITEALARGGSKRAAAMLLGVCPKGLTRRMVELDIVTPPAPHTPGTSVLSDISSEEIRRTFTACGRRLSRLCAKLGVSRPTLRAELKRREIELEVYSGQEPAARPTCDELRRLYVDEEFSTKQIAELHGLKCSKVVLRWLREDGVAIRSHAESVSIAAQKRKMFSRVRREQMMVQSGP